MVKYAAAATLLALFMVPAGADAHAFLEHATPPVGGTVATPPKALDLYYTEGVVPHFSKVELLDHSGHPVSTGPLRAEQDSRELIVPVPHLAPGRYTVIWHVTSQDTHKTEGRFSFSVAG